jgi:hypothetical protein
MGCECTVQNFTRRRALSRVSPNVFLRPRTVFANMYHRFFSFYRDVACTIYPVIGDTVAFENQLNLFLQNRNFAGGNYVSTDENNDKPFGVTLSWLALLFAVIASGSQSSDRPPKERELTSQVYSRFKALSWLANSTNHCYSLLLLPSSSHDKFHVPAIS